MTDCVSIQERLSAYIDEALSSQEKAVVDEHLKTCPECTAALADMKKVIEHIKGLETVEPPPWLTQKVMAKVRAEAQPKKGLFQKLFYPLHIKLPIEALATVLVVGLALYIYRDIAPEMKLAQAPVEEVAPQVLREEKQSIPSTKEGDDKGVTPPVLPLDKGRSEEGLSLKEGKGEVARRTLPATGKSSEQPVLSREAEMKVDKLAESTVQESQKKEQANVPAPVKRPEQMPAAGAVARDEARQPAGAVAPKAKLAYRERTDEKTLIFTVFVKDFGRAVKEIEKILKEFEGKAIHTESLAGREIITATMGVDRVNQLFERLRAIGEVREKELTPEAQDGEVMLRIELRVAR